jgi:hypothetical protein
LDLDCILRLYRSIIRRFGTAGCLTIMPMTTTISGTATLVSMKP